ncbi:MAG: RNA polymerase sigma factor [Labilithrix sp.]|nr:RNA polymerase sigma factor [Labilithrix sp.]
MEYDVVVNAPPPAGPTEASDEEIVARVLGGDVARFEVLMRRHNRRVFRAARAIVRSDDEAEDVMQDAYVSAFTHLADFGGRAKLSTWLVRIAVHAALARLRKTKRVTSLDDLDDLDPRAISEDALTSSMRSPEDAASDVEMRGVLERAVDGLPATFRAVFVLRAVEEMSVDETAAALEIPEATVRTRLHRARGMLREDIARRLDVTAPHAFDFHLSRCDRVVAAVLARILA